jgi:hypothetical protein
MSSTSLRIHVASLRETTIMPHAEAGCTRSAAYSTFGGRPALSAVFAALAARQREKPAADCQPDRLARAAAPFQELTSRVDSGN